MWKKTEDDPYSPPPQQPAKSPPREQRRDVATIGASIAIKGDLTGDEDLLIQGRLEGEVVLRKNNVTVGESGRVKADIYGRTIRVDGEVKGNLYGDQEVIIRSSGRVQGNIVSPRVTLENGANFKGSIDMEPAAAPGPAAAKPSGPAVAVGGRPTAPAASKQPDTPVKVDATPKGG